MSVIKSFSVGDGDMFYINHNSDNFTTIDCCYSDDDNKETNFFYVPGKKHFLLLILFLIYFNMKEKCVENILLILF